MEGKSNLKRIQGEKNLLLKELPQIKIISETTSQQGNVIWHIQLPGPQNCPYEKFNWVIQIEFTNYPFEFPKINMITKIFHPDIEPETGEFCQQMLEADKWVPSKKLYQIINVILTILQNPTGENNLNKEATELIKTKKADFVKKAIEYAKQHAK